ncbi:unnamed protein product [Thelazia callipaeda]|uniref:Bromo domain-containing protein n=1 Tax=Thelazia callipaeda TaxID=103827 RepID=A0A158RBN4_THECL|nr:unnamed protein product [Thelazia callipaeda]
MLSRTQSQDQLNLSNPALTQQFLSSIPQISKFIKDQFENNPDTIRNMISSVLGNGLISHIINPDQLFFGSDISTDEQKEQLFIDGRPVKDENRIRKIYDINRDPNEPERMYVEERTYNQHNNFGKYNNTEQFKLLRPAIQTTTFATNESPASNALIGADMILKTLSQFFGTNSLKEESETSVKNIENNKPTTQFQKDLPPVDISGIDSAFKSEETNVENILDSLKFHEPRTLLPEEVKALQQYLILHEQNKQTRELLNKRQRLRDIQAQLAEHKIQIEEQKFREKQLKMQEAQLREEKLKVENQLQEQFNMWHHAFDVNPSSTLALNNFDERSPRVKLNSHHKHHLHYTFGNQYSEPSNYYDYANEPDESPDYEAHYFANDPEEEFAWKSPASPEISAQTERDLSKYNSNPIYDISDASTLTPNLHSNILQTNHYSSIISPLNRTFTDGRCDCIEMDLKKLRGHWAQPLSSVSLQQAFQYGIAKLFTDTTDFVQLECSSIEFLPAEEMDRMQKVNFLWTFKVVHSEEHYQLTGKIVAGDDRVVQMLLNDFSGQIHRIPICVLKTGEQEMNDYEYMVVVNADGPCRSAAVLVRNPGTFFEEPSRELLYFLRHRVTADELDPMDTHLKPCPT